MGHESAQRNSIRLKWSHTCLYFFAGVVTLPRKRSIPISFVNTSVSHADTIDFVLLPIVDSYYNLGSKMVHMIRWASQLNPETILYLDMDLAERTSEEHISSMFAHMNTYQNEAVVVGDILDCLTIANQRCCCGDLALSLARYYNIYEPYQLLPPMVWGGSGTGITRQAIEGMMRHSPRLHYNGDHTLSAWASSFNASFRQAPWANKHFSWCSGKQLTRRVHPIDAKTWRCNSNVTTKYSF